MKLRRGFARALLSAAIGAVPGAALGQTSGTWVNVGTGNWSNPIHWTSNPLVPGSGGEATLPGNLWGTSTITIDSPVSLSRLGISGPSAYSLGGTTLTLTGAANLDVSSTPSMPQAYSQWYSPNHHRITAPIVATAGLTKTGTGLVVLGGTNSIAGPIALNGGTLIFENAAALGSASPIFVLDGGAVEQSLAVYEPGADVSTSLVVQSIGTISSSMAIGAITGNGTLNFIGEFPYALGGLPSQVWITGDTSFSGHANIAGPVTLTGAGALSHMSSAVLSNQFTAYDEVSGGLSDRIGDTTELTFRGGHLTLVAVAPMTEALGTTLFDRALSVTRINSFTTISFAQIGRTNRAVAKFFTDGPLGQIQVGGTLPPLVGSGPIGTPEVGILPWAMSSSASGSPRPLTVVPGGGSNATIRPLEPSEYIYAVPATVTASNLMLAGGGSVLVPATVNSLTLDSGTLSGPATLSVASGAIFSNFARINAPIDFGTAEGVIHVPDEQGPEITGPISGSGGLTITGWQTTLSGPSTYSGPTTILGVPRITGHVLAGRPGPLGVDSSPVVIEGGGIDVGITFAPPSGTLTFDRDLEIRHFGPATTHLSISHETGAPAATIEISGNIDTDGPVLLDSLNAHSQSRFILSGTITGTGHVHVAIPTTLSGDNTISGGVVLRHTTLNLANDAALGTGNLWINGGTLAAVGSRNIDNSVYVANNFAIAGASTLTYTGSIDLMGAARQIQVSNVAATRFIGPVFNGSLIKSGGGVLEMTNVRLPELTVQQGTLRLIPNASTTATSRVGMLTISPAASLDLTDNDLVIDYTGISPLPLIHQYMADSRLLSSNAIPNQTTLGYAENSLLDLTTFSGQPVDSTALLIKYTYFGDANLDGVVDARDLLRLANGWLGAGSWVHGDFDGDGMVNQADLTLLAKNWQVGDGAPLGQALNDLHLPIVETPEPLAIPLLTAISLLLRRNRRAFDSRIR